MVQWLRCYDPNTGVQGSIPGQGTRSHMLQLRVPMPLKILHVVTKTGSSQIHKNIRNYFNCFKYLINIQFLVTFNRNQNW